MDKETREQLEGSVNVNGDQTPCSRKSVERVDINNWSEMTVTELHEQLAVLQTRLTMAYQYYPHMAKQIEYGINHLTQLINSRSHDQKRELI